MKLSQHTAFATLTLLHHLALAITPVSTPKDEKLDGYIGYLPTPPTGDWLLTTYCYCAQRHRLPAPAFDEGSFFQWEYYNYHRNATYVMHRLCQRNNAERESCVNSKHAHCIPERDGDCEGNMLCSSWPRGDAKVFGKRDASFASSSSSPSTSSFSSSEGAEVKKDHWCMTLDDHNFVGESDSMIWNTQERTLTKKGGQDRKEQADGDAWAVCEGLCGKKVGMPMLRGDKNARSHQEVFEGVDDMCDGCRR